MTFTVKAVFCGGALVTSDELKCPNDNQFAGEQATIITGNAKGVSCSITKSKGTGAISLAPWWNRDDLNVPLKVAAGDQIAITTHFKFGG